MPTGQEKMIQFAHQHAQVVSGAPESVSLRDQRDMSGVAIQSTQWADQQKLAIVLDNLSRCRRMVAMRGLEYVQKFMGAERVMRITEEDPYGVTRHIPYVLNQRMPDGAVLNDLTAGQYDLVLSEQPAQVTFDNSQFEQLSTMRKDMGIKISDARIVRASNVQDKSDIADELQQAAGQANPLEEAEARARFAEVHRENFENF